MENVSHNTSYSEYSPNVKDAVDEEFLDDQSNQDKEQQQQQKDNSSRNEENKRHVSYQSDNAYYGNE